MNILIVDLETSGLMPHTAQSIEIGALIISLDPVSLKTSKIDEFESLINPNAAVDPYVLELTNISTLELESAPQLGEVKTRWQNWLDIYPIDYILGHNISFDLEFLQHENWHIPPHTLLDTMQMLKLLYPDAQAINLEYLIKFLDLDLTLLPHSLAAKSSHRALYDCHVTHLLYTQVIHRLSTTCWLPPQLQQHIVPYILPTTCIVYPNYQSPPESTISNGSIGQWGQSLPTDTEWIGMLESENTLKLLLEWSKLMSQNSVITVLMIACALSYRQYQPKKIIKLHLYHKSDRMLVTCILASLYVPTALQKQPLCVDTLLNHLQDIAGTKTDSETIITLFELLAHCNCTTQEIANCAMRHTQLCSLATHLSINGTLPLKDTHPKQQSWNMQWTEWVTQLGSLNFPVSIDYPLYTAIKKLWDTSMQQILLWNTNKSTIYLGYVRENGILLFYSNVRNIDLYYNQSITHQLTTHTQIDRAETLLSLLSTPTVHNPITPLVSEENNTVYTLDCGWEELWKTDKKTLYLVCNNKLLARIQEHYSQHPSPHTLLYGHHGSLTKILSKAMYSNSSIILRYRDWEQVVTRLPKMYFESVIVVGTPFVPTTPTMQEKAASMHIQNLPQWLSSYALDSLSGQVRLATSEWVYWWNDSRK